jgi:hypothetical protein
MEVVMPNRPDGPWNWRGRAPREFDAPRYGWSDRGRYDRQFEPVRGRYGHDYWWMGEREMPPQRSRNPYDEAYRRFSAQTHPRFSPVGGMEPGGGAGYPRDRSRIHSRENQWFSDWTRWF